MLVTVTSEPCQEVPFGSWQKPEGRQVSEALSGGGGLSRWAGLGGGWKGDSGLGGGRGGLGLGVGGGIGIGGGSGGRLGLRNGGGLGFGGRGLGLGGSAEQSIPLKPFVQVHE